MIKYGNIALTTTITLLTLYHLCLILLVRLGGYIVNLSDFYSYRLIGKLTVSLQLQEFKANWHVRVSKQSCKQANRLILWGVGGAPEKKNLDFFIFFPEKNLKKYDLTRPEVSKYSLTS